MSLEFNRRSFLKYSAAAAVAVAGSSLLVGCGEDEYQKTGKIGSTLKLMGAFKLESASLNSVSSSSTLPAWQILRLRPELPPHFQSAQLLPSPVLSDRIR